MEKAIQETERFEEWMKTRVQNVHYANNAKMTIAYDKVFKNYLKTTLISK
jgi:hypothetical protein